MTDKPAIISVLENAQLAHQSGDFANALEFYEHFFDHALDDDPYALYGVRLNHCLNAWSDLASQFPGAKSSLERKMREMLAQYHQDKEPERFHDYLCIARRLGREAEVLEEFLTLHRNRTKSAAKLVKFLWDDLVNAEQWTVCNEILIQPSLKLDELFAVFDESARLKDYDSSFDNIRFEHHIVDTLLDHVTKIIFILRQANRAKDIEDLEKRFNIAIEHRSNPVLKEKALSKNPFMTY